MHNTAFKQIMHYTMQHVHCALTGEIWHAILGILLILVAAIHIFRQNRKLKAGPPVTIWTNFVLIALWAFLFCTGVMMHPLSGIPVLKFLHKLSAVLFILGIIAHIVQHKKEIT